MRLSVKSVTICPIPHVHLRNVSAQMADHLKRSEAELGELLAEYWALRNHTCE